VEGLLLGIMGIILGFILGHVFAYFLQYIIETSRHMTLDTIVFNPAEPYVALIALAISGIVALIPALMAYRVNVAAVLSKGI
jgi:putative ABC transport system permease protein